MSDYNEQTLMEAVIKRVAGAPDPRLRQIMTSLVTHLHGFVRDVRPTSEEWLAGIQFLTAVGQKCDDKRQEFVLLSDSLGVSMLVDLISYGKVGNATESDLLGPAWVEAAPELPLGSNLAEHPGDGEPCVITGSVASLNGTPWRAQWWISGKPTVTGSTTCRNPTVSACGRGCGRMPQASFGSGRCGR